MQLLMVSSYLPYPLFNGGNIRLYNLLKHLSNKHEITLICEVRENQTEKDVEEVRKFCKKITLIPRKKQWSFKNIMSTGFSFDPFLVVGHRSSAMKTAVKKELIENNFDLIHVETFYVLQNVPKTSVPIVLTEHNIEYLVYQRYVNEAVPWIRPILNIDIAKLKRKEIESWKRADHIITVSEEEKKIIKSCVQKEVSVVPNGVDIEKFRMENKKELKEKLILFIGDFKWIENRDSLNWILEKVWTKISNKFNAKLWIVGRNIPKKITQIQGKNIIFSKNLSDTPKIYEKSYILLAPIKVGGGTSFKILEAMASGVPVVTTPLGAEGIGKNYLLTGNTSGEIAEQVEKLLLDWEFYKKTSASARSFVEKKFNWKDIVSKLDKVYEEVLND